MLPSRLADEEWDKSRGCRARNSSLLSLPRLFFPVSHMLTFNPILSDSDSPESVETFSFFLLGKQNNNQIIDLVKDGKSADHESE